MIGTALSLPVYAETITFAVDGHVGFEIEDNGIGLDRKNIDHIFDFGKSYQRSSGLGL
jgi:signal transduction histidine kinase